MPVNPARMFEGVTHGALRNLVEGDAAEALVFLVFLFFLFALPAVAAQFLGQMRSDGLAFAIRVGRQLNGIRGIGQLLQLGDDFLFAGNDDVFRFYFNDTATTES